MIPKLIHQSWQTTDLSTYGKIAVRSQNSWKRLYPDFEYKFWTDEDIAKYIKKQPLKYQDTFHTLDKNIKKMDFFRYLILYEYGGIYVDMDFIARTRIENKILLDYGFIGYKAHRPTDGTNFTRRNPKATSEQNAPIITDECGRWALGQAFFACEQGHEGIQLLIDDIAKNRNSKLHPLDHTGPEKIHNIFVNNNLMFSKSTFIFSMLEMSNGMGTVGGHHRNHKW